MSISNRLCRTLVTFGTTAFLAGSAIPAIAGDNAQATKLEAAPNKSKASEWKPAVEPKPLTPQVNKGLSWLLEHQLRNGA
jgi:hypothetical protein